MFMFFRIERPTTATLRPFAIATSAACCMRWMFEANDATTIRPVRSGISCRNASPTSRSEPVMPGPLRVRRVAEQQVDAAVPELGERADVGLQAVDGRVVELPVARCGGSRPAGVSTTTAIESGIEWAIRTNSRRNGPSWNGSLRGSTSVRTVVAPSPCSSSFDFTSASVRRGADDLADLDLAQDVRQAADVVLVAVREDDRAQRAAFEVGEVGQDEVDAEVLVAREGEPRVDHDPVLAVLEDGHVLPDLAEAAERDDSEWRSQTESTDDPSR